MKERWAGWPMAVARNRCNTGPRYRCTRGPIGGNATRKRGQGVGISGAQATRKRVEDLLDTDEARGLFETGRENGSLTAEEIALAFDDLELEAGQLDELYQALE